MAQKNWVAGALVPLSFLLSFIICWAIVIPDLIPTRMTGHPGRPLQKGGGLCRYRRPFSGRPFSVSPAFFTVAICEHFLHNASFKFFFISRSVKVFHLKTESIPLIHICETLTGKKALPEVGRARFLI
jgi:hypothetical protein